MLRQAKNTVKIEGILSQVNLEYGTYVNKEGKTVENIGGTINVKVEQNDTVLDIPVHMFSNKYTKAGKLNPAYDSIEKVKTEFTSIAACGNEEQADKIRITSGEIRMNDFTGRDGKLVSQPRITTSFVNKVFKGFNPEATFSLEFMVQNIVPAVDKEGVEIDPKKLTITAIVPQYGENVDVVTLVASNPNVVSAIESYWENGNCYSAVGKVNFTSTTQEYQEPVDFGEPITKTRTVSLSEFVVTGGSQEPLDETTAFAKEDIKAALDKRAAKIEERKTKADAKKAPAPTTSEVPFDLGF